MSLYLVRWPWLTASIVSARNEDDLRDILDEVADIEGVTWSVYRGPLWVDFHVPAKVRIEEKKKGVPLRPDEIVIDDLKALEAGKFELDMPEYSEHTAEMCELITKKAFPNLHKVLFGDIDDVEHAPPAQELEAALRKDLEPLISADWSRATRGQRTDELGRIAQNMGTSVAQVESILRRAGQLPPKGQGTRGEIRKFNKKKRDKGKAPE